MKDQLISIKGWGRLTLAQAEARVIKDLEEALEEAKEGQFELASLMFRQGVTELILEAIQDEVE